MGFGQSNKVPPCVIPASILLVWLYYQGVPTPKGTTKSILLEQVQRARDIDQPMDKDHVLTRDYTTARSYVSIDSITPSSSVKWENNSKKLLSLLRCLETTQINTAYTVRSIIICNGVFSGQFQVPRVVRIVYIAQSR